MKKKAVKVSKSQKIAFMKKHKKLYNKGKMKELVKLIRKKFKYSDKTCDIDISISFKNALKHRYII